MKNKKVLLLCETALMTALMCVCAWITVPLPAVPVTLQTFAVFFALLFLGGKWGTVSVALYLSLGVLGLPVFSGMRGGFGILFGSTGGYLFGFLFAGVLFLVFENILKTNLGKILLCAGGLLLTYTVGTAWYYLVYLSQGNAVSLGGVLLSCVVPFILPDGVKIALAWVLSGKIKSALKN